MRPALQPARKVMIQNCGNFLACSGASVVLLEEFTQFQMEDGQFDSDSDCDLN